MTYQNSANNRDINQPVNAQSGTTYVALLSDTIIAMSNVAARQVTLPAPSASGITSTVGKVYTVKDVAGTAATANITVTPAGGFIDGGTEVLIATNYGSASFYSDGVAWYSQAANYAAGVSLAYGSWVKNATTGASPYTVATFQSTANFNTIGNSASRLTFSSLTQNSLNNLTVSANQITFTQSGTYEINISDGLVNSASITAYYCIQIVKNGTTLLSTGVGLLNNWSSVQSTNYLGNFAAGDFFDVRYVYNGTATPSWVSNAIDIKQLPTSVVPSLAGNTPTQNIQVFTSSGTYTPSANLQYAIVECVGGGGGGSGAQAAGCGGGGGGGGYARGTFSAVALGASQSVTIGTAGAAGTGSTTNGVDGSAGGTTSFGALLSATGGSPASTRGGAGIPVSAPGGAGGTGSGGSFQATGQGGGAGVTTGTGSTGGHGGNGGSSLLGGGGRAVAGVGGSSAGIAGGNYGGGGGGCFTFSGTVSGGAGTAGVCIVTEFIYAPPPLTTTASITWNAVPGTSQSMSASNGYYTQNSSLTTLTLPVTCLAGTTIEVTGAGTGLWTIAQNASQNIRYGNQVTTTGVGGSISSQAQGDGITLVCVVANTTWQVVDSIGNLTVV